MIDRITGAGIDGLVEHPRMASREGDQGHRAHAVPSDDHALTGGHRRGQHRDQYPLDRVQP
jgi:hypothetical protein